MAVVLELKEFDSFIELEKPPTTWQGAMEALVAGAVDYDELEPLIIECAAIADAGLNAQRPRMQAEAKARGKMDMTPTWRWCSDVYWKHLDHGRKLGIDDCPTDIVSHFISMGKAADEWLASQTT